MKWIFSLISLAILSSCTTKPYMVGSVNEQFYKRYRTPGAGYKSASEAAAGSDFDYTWQEQLHHGARLPVAYRENKAKVIIQEEAVYAPPAAPYTSSK